MFCEAGGSNKNIQVTLFYIDTDKIKTKIKRETERLDDIILYEKMSSIGVLEDMWLLTAVTASFCIATTEKLVSSC